LYEKYKDQDFVILGFPCNQFGAQEPGTNDQIKEFVKQFNVTFPLFDKIDVNGDGADPLFKFLTGSIGEVMLGVPYNRILWNFAKFLVDRNGFPVKRFGSKTNPLSFEDDIVLVMKSGL
jgi:glutathione peroxidase